MTDKKRLKGLIAAAFTPMRENGTLALECINSLIELYKINDVTGAFICRSTGESASLSFNEKLRVLETWGDSNTEKLVTIFMVGGTRVDEMRQLALQAQNKGLNGIAMLAPYYFKPKDETHLVQICKEVASSAPDTPFYYYHIPSLTGVNFDMFRFLQIADIEIPNFSGIKYSSQNIVEFQKCCMFKGGKYDILWGVDEALLSGLAAGAEGAVGSTYNYAAPLYNKIIQAFQACDLQHARQLQYKAVLMVDLLNKYDAIGAGKAIMKLIGVDCGLSRSPISTPDQSEIQDLKRELKNIGFFDLCSVR